RGGRATGPNASPGADQVRAFSIPSPEPEMSSTAWSLAKQATATWLNWNRHWDRTTSPINSSCSPRQRLQ
ncbi:hypothetical protein ABTE74_22365, partial [Acinetobacter baumannii]